MRENALCFIIYIEYRVNLIKKQTDFIEQEEETNGQRIKRNAGERISKGSISGYSAHGGTLDARTYEWDTCGG